MQAVTPRPGQLLLDDAAARYVRGKGYSPVRCKPYSRWPWVEHKLDLRNDFPDDAAERANLLAKLVRNFGYRPGL